MIDGVKKDTSATELCTKKKASQSGMINRSRLLRVRSPFLGLGFGTELYISQRYALVRPYTDTCMHASPSSPPRPSHAASPTPTAGFRHARRPRTEKQKCSNEPRIFLSPTPIPRESQLTAQFSSILTISCYCMVTCLNELPESRIAVRFFQARRNEEALRLIEKRYCSLAMLLTRCIEKSLNGFQSSIKNGLLIPHRTIYFWQKRVTGKSRLCCHDAIFTDLRL